MKDCKANGYGWDTLTTGKYQEPNKENGFGWNTLETNYVYRSMSCALCQLEMTIPYDEFVENIPQDRHLWFCNHCRNFAQCVYQTVEDQKDYFNQNNSLTMEVEIESYIINCSTDVDIEPNIALYHSSTHSLIINHKNKTAAMYITDSIIKLIYCKIVQKSHIDRLQYLKRMSTIA